MREGRDGGTGTLAIGTAPEERREDTTRAVAEIRRLRRMRPRNRFVHWSLAALFGLSLGSWIFGNFGLSGWIASERLRNLERFAGELRPYPLQGRAWDTGIALEWASGLMASRGWEAAAATLAISVAAIALAAVLGTFLSLPAARTLISPEPFLPGPRRASMPARLLSTAVLVLTRFVLTFLRSIPEYVWAFLLLAMLGPTAWPAVLALALHNAGILGKLNAEVIENLERPVFESLRALGAGRAQIVIAGVSPVAFPRFLLLFFYRWETCVREATVLGMLGISSLGFWIQDARARNLYDEMFFLVLVGAGLILIGDLLSALARTAVRRA